MKDYLISKKLALLFIVVTFLVAGCSLPKTSGSSGNLNGTPPWFDIELEDVQTGQKFTMNDYAGKVVLVETMAMWCPNCIVQANEVRKLHALLGESNDLISVSLDVDVNEDAESLRKYCELYGFDWHYAIAPLEVARALGNLYSAQYLNPPLSPMLVIDQVGNVHMLEYGQKSAEKLLETVKPFLSQ